MRWLPRLAALIVTSSVGLLSVLAQTPDTAIHSSVVVDSNPAVFAVLAAVNAAGYDAGLPSSSKAPSLRQQVRAALAGAPAEAPAPALKDLQDFYRTHQLANPSQTVAQYVTLALFLGNPPGLTLTLPAAGLPPSAAAVADVVPILQRYYAQAHVEAAWVAIQSEDELAMAQDETAVRKSLAMVDAFFRMPQNYSPRQYFIFPDPLLASGHSDALSYEDNYYFVSNLDLGPQMQQVRHTYLHFLLDPLIASYPAVFTPVEQQILPLVQDAPALETQFKRDAQLFYTECLVHAAEIVLDGGTAPEQQAKVGTAMANGLVLTQFWYGELTTYRRDPAGFREFYPEAAFAARMDEIAGRAKHIIFAPAPTTQVAEVQPMRVPSLLEQAQVRFDAHDFAAATNLAQAELRKPRPDAAGAWFLLGKVATASNQPAEAVSTFEKAVATAGAAAGDSHIRTWSNIFLARLFDAENDRTQAIAHYKAALLSADTPASKALAEAGVKAPYHPETAHPK
ncbi:MAG: tetratricopeptide repeat protein [Terriglobales bacterium]